MVQTTTPIKQSTGGVAVAAAGDDDEERTLEKALNDETLAKAEREELKRIMAEEKITLLEEEELVRIITRYSGLIEWMLTILHAQMHRANCRRSIASRACRCPMTSCCLRLVVGGAV